MSKPTPGPWRISTFEERTGGTARVVMGADDFAVARCMDRSVEEHEADARLIASAPELLQSLKDMKVCFQVALLSFPLDIAKEGMETVRDAEAIISKAEGK